MTDLMGMVATGVILHVSATGIEYGMHVECADKLVSAVPIGAVAIMGPLFAPREEWRCAHSECAS